MAERTEKMTQVKLRYSQVNILLLYSRPFFKKKKNMVFEHTLYLRFNSCYIQTCSFILGIQVWMGKMILIICPLFLMPQKTCSINVVWINWVPIKTKSLLNVDGKKTEYNHTVRNSTTLHTESRFAYETKSFSMIDNNNERNSKWARYITEGYLDPTLLLDSSRCKLLLKCILL